MVVAISYSLDNDRIFRNGLDRAKSAMADLRLPFALIASDFYKSEQAIFKLKGPGKYPDYKSGGPQSPYAKRKQRITGFTYPLLVRSGSLAASVLSPSAPGSVYSATEKELTIGTSISYAGYHQSDEPRSKIPLRKFLFIGPEARDVATSEQMGRVTRWLNILNDHALRALKS